MNPHHHQEGHPGRVLELLSRHPIAATLFALYAACYWRNGRAISRAGPFGPRWLAVALARFFSWIMTALGRCPVKTLVLPPAPFDSKKQYLVVWHPHGAYTTMAFMKCALYTTTSTPVEWYPGIAPFLFQVPFFREALLLMNARSVDARTMNKLAAAGYTIGLQPGGIPEQLEADHTREKAVFPAKLGFIRLAMRHGVPLLPVYIFGEGQAYKIALGDIGRAFARWTYRVLRAPMVPVLGLWNLPWMVPNPTDVSVCWGRPVDVGPPNASPTDAEVTEVLHRYVAELRRVFDAHKDECLPPEIAQKGLEVKVLSRL